ncbi:MAG: hypothetical protein AB7G62_08310 [Magnetospirillum sp.]
MRKRLADSLVWRILGIATTIEFVAFGMYFTLPANLQLWVEGAILR